MIIPKNEMRSYFVPYHGDKPAAVHVNGHKVLILSQDRASIEQDLEIVGADCVKQVLGGESVEDERKVLTKIAQTSRSGIVIAPNELGIKEVIRNLEAELPWLQ